MHSNHEVLSALPSCHIVSSLSLCTLHPFSPLLPFSHLCSPLLISSQLLSPLPMSSHLFSTFINSSPTCHLLSCPLKSSHTFSPLPTSFQTFSQLFSALLTSSRLFSPPVTASQRFSTLVTSCQLFSPLLTLSLLFSPLHTYSQPFSTVNHCQNICSSELGDETSFDQITSFPYYTPSLYMAYLQVKQLAIFWSTVNGGEFAIHDLQYHDLAQVESLHKCVYYVCCFRQTLFHIPQDWIMYN